MWSQILLCLLVALAAAGRSPGWKDNTEYTYQVRGRTLASLHDISDQYSGIILKAQLIIRPRSDGSLTGKISQAQYASVHSALPWGWESHIPDDKLSYRQLPLTTKPFKVVMSSGVVRDLIVDQEVAEWEANILKSIVSQIQLDTKGQNVIENPINTLPEEQSNNAVFKTLEDTVTGISETLYEIHPLPEHILKSDPWIAPFPHLKGDGEIIEIKKSKNYSDSTDLPQYYYGLGDIGNFEPGTNQLGQFMTRTSVSRAIITGNLNRYTIQSSVTINKIYVSPSINNNKKGSVISMLNITLSNAQPQSEKFEEMSTPVSLGRLVYSYSRQTDNKVRPGRKFNPEQFRTVTTRRNNLRNIRSVSSSSEEIDNQDYESNEQYGARQEKPNINDYPVSPMLPYTTGYMGHPIKKNGNVNIVQEVTKLAQEVGQEMTYPENIPKKQTLAKFNIMTSLIRSMSKTEIEQIAKNVFTTETKGQKWYSWVAFRDAVAETGTGPALVNIKEWIQTKKVQHEEAAELVDTMIHAARQPTEEYVRTLFNFITKTDLANQHTINETSLWDLTDLLRRVYVDKYLSHRQYPSHSFGNFRTTQGRTFLKKEVIPYLEQKLNEAITKADTHNIHVYIRALGNIGHPQILRAFEPYLEGKKHVSQFQRLLMVMAMDELAKAHPTTAISVTRKLYQNIGETHEVRIAALYQLVRAILSTTPRHPSLALYHLQDMVFNTHADKDQHVNSVVKSFIEHAATLDGDEFATVRSAAKAARHLLNRKVYGFQYSNIHLYNYIERNWKLETKHASLWMNGKDSIVPKVMSYSIRTKFGDIARYRNTFQMMVSSIDELLNVMTTKTEYHQKWQQEKTQQPKNAKYSSEYIAKMLNMQTEHREQLEGFLYAQFGKLHKYMSFDNHTFDRLPQRLRELEETLKNGKNYNYVKLINPGEMTIAFPTETGFPFIYTFDMPTILKFEATIKAETKPPISSSDKIHRPDSIESQLEIRALLSTKMQTQLGFFTPFDQQKYIAGYDKNFQVNIPIRAKISLNLKDDEIKMQLEPLEPEKNVRMVEYSTWPYTSKQQIASFKPIAEIPETQIIRKKMQSTRDHTFGKRSTGMAFRVRFSTDYRYSDFAYIYQKLQTKDYMSILMTPLAEGTVQHTKLKIDYAGQTSETRSLSLRLAYQKKYQEETNDSTQKVEIEDLIRMPSERVERRKEMHKKVASGIPQAKVYSYEAEAEFKGQRTIKYITQGFLAKNDQSPKSRILFYFAKEGNVPESKPFNLAAVVKSHFPNTNGLDYTYASKFDPTSTVQMQLAYGENWDNPTKIKWYTQWKKSEERKQYLLEQPIHHECKREMEQGNYQLPACAALTQAANLMDHVNVKVEYENIGPETLNSTYKTYSFLRHLFYSYVEEDVFANKQVGNEVMVEARFHPDFEAVNISVTTNEMRASIRNVPINEYVKPVVAVHPVFHMPARIYAKYLESAPIRPFCVVDKSAILTYDNLTFYPELTNEWTLMHQYVPRRAHHLDQDHSVPEQMQKQIENYAVLIRQYPSDTSKKEVKIMVQTPETQEKLTDITVMPSTSNIKGKVYMNNQEIILSQDKLKRFFNDYIEMYALPNGEVKIEITDAFYLIYDGTRAKLTITDDKFRNSIRGICGNFNGLRVDELQTPKECFVKDPNEFVASYVLMESGSQNQRLMDLRSRSQKNHCVYWKKPLYVNVITPRDMHMEDHSLRKSVPTCTAHRPRYVVENDQTCFTLRPLPQCMEQCQQRGVISKNVEVFCLKNQGQESTLGKMYKAQIDQGANPDFTLKAVSKNVRMELPQSCTQ